MIFKINDRFRVRTIEFFNNVKITSRFDSVAATFKVDFEFDPNNPEHKELACIGHVHECTFEHNNELLATGYLLSNHFRSGSKKLLTSLGGYSKPGVIEDCEIPIHKTGPLESESLNLKQVVEKYLKPFGLTVVIKNSASSAMGETYEEVDAKETESVKAFICDLAAQKNIIVSHDEYGRLVFLKAVRQSPIFHFEPGVECVLDMEMVFNAQPMHSEIVVFAQSGKEVDISDESPPVPNPYIPYVFRPHIAVQSTDNSEDTIRAAKNILARELKNLQLIIKLDRVVLNGKVIRAGQWISVKNPECYLYTTEKWIIEQVDMDFDSENEDGICTLTCVRPEVYTGETPVYIFKGINTHG